MPARRAALAVRRSRHQAASTGAVAPLEQAQADLRRGEWSAWPMKRPRGIVHGDQARGLGAASSTSLR